jgi:DNA-binding transcriptional regulator YdaS (Cro superfamily)
VRIPEPESGRALLLQWFEATGCARNMFAKAVGVSPPMVNEWLRENDDDRRSTPKGSKRKLIDRVTDGAVPERAWETAEERAAVAQARPIVLPKQKRAAAGGAR